MEGQPSTKLRSPHPTHNCTLGRISQVQSCAAPTKLTTAPLHPWSRKHIVYNLTALSTILLQFRAPSTLRVMCAHTHAGAHTHERKHTCTLTHTQQTRIGIHTQAHNKCIQTYAGRHIHTYAHTHPGAAGECPCACSTGCSSCPRSCTHTLAHMHVHMHPGTSGRCPKACLITLDPPTSTPQPHTYTHRHKSTHAHPHPHTHAPRGRW